MENHALLPRISQDDFHTLLHQEGCNRFPKSRGMPRNTGTHGIAHAKRMKALEYLHVDDIVFEKRGKIGGFTKLIAQLFEIGASTLYEVAAGERFAGCRDDADAQAVFPGNWILFDIPDLVECIENTKGRRFSYLG